MSQRFCAADSDITIKSSDGVLFQLHQANLKISSGSWKVGMPDYHSEPSAVLDLLFRFCYPERQPDLNNINFDILTKLAEAAEKYKVFPAINFCRIVMRDQLPLNAVDVLVYGVKHAYPDVYQKVAPLVVLQKSLSEILPKLPNNVFMPWVLYHEKWVRVAQEAVSYHKIWADLEDARAYRSRPLSKTLCSCRQGHVGDAITSLLRQLGAGLESYANMETLFKPSCGCNHPHIMFSPWRKFVEENIANIPPFNGPSMPSVSTITCQDEASGQTVSTRFSAADSDVTFVSSDGVPFCIHKINLTVSAGGFAPPEFETQGEDVHLAETAQTLELLFQFCYPDYYPDVEVLEFSEFAMLAEAAEKYQVFSAMSVCKTRMKKLLPDHAADILAYAAWHDYPDILDVAAPLVVCKERLSDTLPKLPPHFVLRWVKFFETVWPMVPMERVAVAVPVFSTVN